MSDYELSTDYPPLADLLTPDQLRVTELLALGWTLHDIARITDTTPWNVRNHITRAIQRIPESVYPDVPGRSRLLMWLAASRAQSQQRLQGVA